jgi:hypothetical protein
VLGSWIVGDEPCGLGMRDQRGPIYTVPFGALGAVQNMSRDWVSWRAWHRIIMSHDERSLCRPARADPTPSFRALARHD